MQWPPVNIWLPPVLLLLTGERQGCMANLLRVQVLELMELTSLRDAIVGLPGLSGLSVEQRKRLTIGVELVANPSIVFMDVSHASICPDNLVL